MGDLHRRGVGVAVHRDHFRAETHRLEGDLASEFAAAEEHDAGGVAHERASDSVAERDTRSSGKRSHRTPARERSMNNPRLRVS